MRGFIFVTNCLKNLIGATENLEWALALAVETTNNKKLRNIGENKKYIFIYYIITNTMFCDFVQHVIDKDK